MHFNRYIEANGDLPAPYRSISSTYAPRKQEFSSANCSATNIYTCFQGAGTQVNATTAVECCALCSKSAACSVWTLAAPSTCRLLHQDTLANSCAGISGSGSTTLPPQKVMLFNLTADPTESNDVADRFPDVVSRLTQRMQVKNMFLHIYFHLGACIS